MLDKEIESGWREFLTLCRRTNSVEQLDELLQLFLTFEEKETMAARVLLVQELLRGELTQRDIAHKLNISIAKITRGSNALKTVSEEIKKFITTVA